MSVRRCWCSREASDSKADDDGRHNYDPRSNDAAKKDPALLISAISQVSDGPGIHACRQYEHRYYGPASQ